MKLHLIPTPLGENELTEVLPQYLLDSITGINLFFVEELRTARRFLSKAGFRGKIDELTLLELNEHTPRETIEEYSKLLKTRDAAIISEAGLPAVADPGALLVELAHKMDVEVIPYVGPSSLMMALMSSGMNGQCFAFNGYLPVKKEERRSALINIEKISSQRSQSQIMIETPYRNDSLLEEMLSTLKESTKICIAADITLPTQYIKTKSVAQWKKAHPTIGKRPCVFIIQA